MPETPELQQLNRDETLIVGAGIAGLFTALQMAPQKVTIITAAPLGTGGSSTWAQGGLAAAMGEDDSPDLHYQDTVKAGVGLVDEPAARILTEEGPARVRDLMNYGIAFDADDDGKLKLGREAAHNRKRIVHASGDQAGATIMAGLAKAARAADHITIREGIVAEELMQDGNGAVVGVVAVAVDTGSRLLIAAPRTLLATGGIGGLFAVTTNPVHAQGHGLSMAFRAGAEIMDPEFVQFHPTALDIGVDPAPLATEALRGEGAWLVNIHDERIMAGIHLAKELAPRDIVARAVAKSIATGNGAFLDARAAIGSNFSTMFPTVFAACEKAGLDPARDLIPVAPAAHYHMGGIRTSEDGKTSLSGLWAVGEIANTGVHGANRLASNSLLEALVFGARAARSLKADDASKRGGKVSFPTGRLDMPASPATPEEIMILRRLMSDNAGLIRSRQGLGEALEFVHDTLLAVNVTSGYHSALTAASLILGGANNRLESRGSHYRTDYPDNNRASHGIMWLDHAAQKAKYRTEPVKQVSLEMSMV